MPEYSFTTTKRALKRFVESAGIEGSFKTLGSTRTYRRNALHIPDDLKSLMSCKYKAVIKHDIKQHTSHRNLIWFCNSIDIPCNYTTNMPLYKLKTQALEYVDRTDIILNTNYRIGHLRINFELYESQLSTIFKRIVLNAISDAKRSTSLKQVMTKFNIKLTQQWVGSMLKKNATMLELKAVPGGQDYLEALNRFYKSAYDLQNWSKIPTLGKLTPRNKHFN